MILPALVLVSAFLVLPLHVISNAQAIGKIKTRHVAWSVEDVDFAKVTALIRSVLKSIQARPQCK